MSRKRFDEEIGLGKKSEKKPAKIEIVPPKKSDKESSAPKELIGPLRGAKNKKDVVNALRAELNRAGSIRFDKIVWTRQQVDSLIDQIEDEDLIEAAERVRLPEIVSKAIERVEKPLRSSREKVKKVETKINQPIDNPEPAETAVQSTTVTASAGPDAESLQRLEKLTQAGASAVSSENSDSTKSVEDEINSDETSFETEEQKECKILKKELRVVEAEKGAAALVMNESKKDRVKQVIQERIDAFDRKIAQLKFKIDLFEGLDVESVEINGNSVTIEKVFKKSGHETVIDKGEKFEGLAISDITRGGRFSVIGGVRTSRINSIKQCSDGSYLIETQTSFYRVRRKAEDDKDINEQQNVVSNRDEIKNAGVKNTEKNESELKPDEAALKSGITLEDKNSELQERENINREVSDYLNRFCSSNSGKQQLSGLLNSNRARQERLLQAGSPEDAEQLAIIAAVISELESRLVKLGAQPEEVETMEIANVANKDNNSGNNELIAKQIEKERLEGVLKNARLNFVEIDLRYKGSVGKSVLKKIPLIGRLVGYERSPEYDAAQKQYEQALKDFRNHEMLNIHEGTDTKELREIYRGLKVSELMDLDNAHFEAKKQASEGTVMGRVLNKCRTEIEAYNKLPLKRKLAYAGVIMGTGVLAAGTGGGAAVLGVSALGVFRRTLSGVGATMATEALLRRNHENKLNKEALTDIVDLEKEQAGRVEAIRALLQEVEGADQRLDARKMAAGRRRGYAVATGAAMSYLMPKAVQAQLNDTSYGQALKTFVSEKVNGIFASISGHKTPEVHQAPIKHVDKIPKPAVAQSPIEAERPAEAPKPQSGGVKIVNSSTANNPDHWARPVAPVESVDVEVEGEEVDVEPNPPMPPEESLQSVTSPESVAGVGTETDVEVGSIEDAQEIQDAINGSDPALSKEFTVTYLPAKGDIQEAYVIDDSSGTRITRFSGPWDADKVVGQFGEEQTAYKEFYQHTSVNVNGQPIPENLRVTVKDIHELDLDIKNTNQIDFMREHLKTDLSALSNIEKKNVINLFTLEDKAGMAESATKVFGQDLIGEKPLIETHGGVRTIELPNAKIILADGKFAISNEIANEPNFGMTWSNNPKLILNRENIKAAIEHINHLNESELAPHKGTPVFNDAGIAENATAPKVTVEQTAVKIDNSTTTATVNEVKVNDKPTPGSIEHSTNFVDTSKSTGQVSQTADTLKPVEQNQILQNEKPQIITTVLTDREARNLSNAAHEGSKKFSGFSNEKVGSYLQSKGIKMGKEEKSLFNILMEKNREEAAQKYSTDHETHPLVRPFRKLLADMNSINETIRDRATGKMQILLSKGDYNESVVINTTSTNGGPSYEVK